MERLPHPKSLNCSWFKTKMKMDIKCHSHLGPVMRRKLVWCHFKYQDSMTQRGVVRWLGYFDGRGLEVGAWCPQSCPKTTCTIFRSIPATFNKDHPLARAPVHTDTLPRCPSPGRLPKTWFFFSWELKDYIDLVCLCNNYWSWKIIWGILLFKKKKKRNIT